MTDFGGLGGLKDGRSLNIRDAFEVAVQRSLGAKIIADDDTAKAMWCALANVDWTHKNGDTAVYSFRAAGDLVAAVRGSGNYMDWYCCGHIQLSAKKLKRRYLPKVGLTINSYKMRAKWNISRY